MVESDAEPEVGMSTKLTEVRGGPSMEPGRWFLALNASVAEVWPRELVKLVCIGGVVVLLILRSRCKCR